MIDLIQKLLHKGDSHSFSAGGPVIVFSVENLSDPEARVKVSVRALSSPTRPTFRTRKAGSWVDYCEVTGPSKVTVTCDSGTARVLVTAGTEIPEEDEATPDKVVVPVSTPTPTLVEEPVEMEDPDNSDFPIHGNEEPEPSDDEEESDWGMSG